jgi:phosphohistidine phosphatase SixA
MLRTLLIAVALLLTALPASATDAGWALLREGGYVVLMRHAYAPGTGDPAGFDIENCRTQRNLSDRGRQQARKIGVLVATRAAPVAKVLSSRYCRCLDTARLAFGQGAVEETDVLDPIVAGAADADQRKTRLLEAIASFSDYENLIMVTHDETIAAITGQHAREGEVVIVRAQGETVRVLGRIAFN